MLFGIETSIDREKIYIHDTITGSVYTLSYFDASVLLISGVHIVNLRFNDERNGIDFSERLPLTDNAEVYVMREDTYVNYTENISGIHKIINMHGKPSFVSDKYLEQISQSNMVVNSIQLNKNTFRYDGVQITKPDIDFNSYIQNEYKQFVAKAKLLGTDMRFEFRIKNYDVIIKKYTGTSKNVIIPKFITAISSKAFAGLELESVRLNDGLKIIGNSAFSLNRIEKVIIPPSVMIVGSSAFDANKSPTDRLRTMSIIQTSNPNTVILDLDNY